MRAFVEQYRLLQTNEYTKHPIPNTQAQERALEFFLLAGKHTSISSNSMSNKYWNPPAKGFKLNIDGSNGVRGLGMRLD